MDRAAKLEVRSLGGSKGYVSGRCAAMIGGMCRFTRLRGRVPTRRRTKKKKKKTGNEGSARVREERKRRRRGGGKTMAAPLPVIIWCNAAIKGITRIDGYNFRGKWPTILLPLFNATRLWPSLYPFPPWRFPRPRDVPLPIPYRSANKINLFR